MNNEGGREIRREQSYVLFLRHIQFDTFDVAQELLDGRSDLLSDLRVLVSQSLNHLATFVQFNLKIMVTLQFLINGQCLLGNELGSALTVLDPLLVEGILLVEFIQLKMNLLAEIQALRETVVMGREFRRQPVDFDQLQGEKQR